MRPSLRFPLLVLACVASSVAPAVASAQSTPADQPFVVASNVSMPNTTDTLTAALAPSSFGCTGNQVFFVRSALVSAVPHSGGIPGYNLTFQVAQPRQGAPTPAPFVFFGSGTSATTFVLSSVGAPVTSISLYKGGYAASFSILLWGYCANPTTLGALTWK